MTYGELVRAGEEVLKKADIYEYKNDAFLLFEFVSGMDRARYYMCADESVSAGAAAGISAKNAAIKIKAASTKAAATKAAAIKAAAIKAVSTKAAATKNALTEADSIKAASMEACPIEAAYMEVIRRRARHEPLQYITGNQEFMGLEFEVDENVLIPRQDTEIVAETAIRFLRESCKNPCPRVLDMCTGSGCIAVSIASLVKNARVCGVDISGAALEIAKKNAGKNGADVTFIKSNLFENPEIDHAEPYDMIISNPPYIPTEMMCSLMPEVRDHEPGIALDGYGDGLFFYREITLHAKKRMKPGGILIYETGNTQAKDVSGILAAGGYTDIGIIKDLAGNDRCVVSYLRNSVNWHSSKLL